VWATVPSGYRLEFEMFRSPFDSKRS
jgi:hypothetical protein